MKVIENCKVKPKVSVDSLVRGQVIKAVVQEGSGKYTGYFIVNNLGDYLLTCLGWARGSGIFPGYNYKAKEIIEVLEVYPDASVCLYGEPK